MNTSKCPLCNSVTKASFVGHDFMFNRENTYNYSKCSNCYLLFLDPLPSKKRIVSFYPKTYENYLPPKNKKLSLFQSSRLYFQYGYSHLKKKNFYKYLFKILPKSPEIIEKITDGKFLDIGCGNGSRILKMKNLGWDTYGVEFNKGAAEQCRNIGLNVKSGDLLESNYKSNFFDIVYMSHLIEHLKNPKETLSFVNKILKKDGYLYINTPNSNAIGRFFFGKYWFANEVPRHLMLYNSKNIELLAKKTGFKLVSKRYKTTPKIILNSIDYVLDKKSPSKKNSFFRALARIYVLLNKILFSGDELFVMLKKVN